MTFVGHWTVTRSVSQHMVRMCSGVRWIRDAAGRSWLREKQVYLSKASTEV